MSSSVRSSESPWWSNSRDVLWLFAGYCKFLPFGDSFCSAHCRPNGIGGVISILFVGAGYKYREQSSGKVIKI
jgi:hypothetical protein